MDAEIWLSLTPEAVTLQAPARSLQPLLKSTSMEPGQPMLSVFKVQAAFRSGAVGKCCIICISACHAWDYTIRLANKALTVKTLNFRPKAPAKHLNPMVLKAGGGGILDKMMPGYKVPRQR